MNTSGGAQPIGTCVLLLSPGGSKILLGKRKNAYKAGWFGAPGGHLDIGESLEACARRELLEETGVVAKQLQYLGCVRDWQGEFDFFHFVFACTDYEGVPQVMEPEKCEGWEWYAPDQLPSPTLDGHAAGVRLWQRQSEVPFLIDLHQQNFQTLE